jgi:putative hydrolase of the HAD superfamily
MHKTNVKIIFSDIGGVLLTNGWGHQSRQKAAEVFGFDYEEMNVLHEFIFNIYEIGKISLDAYLDTILFHRPRDFTREDVKAFMFAQSEELPGTLQWLIEWKRAQPDIKFIAINNEGKELTITALKNSSCTAASMRLSRRAKWACANPTPVSSAWQWAWRRPAPKNACTSTTG